jgi:hypothetical protein
MAALLPNPVPQFCDADGNPFAGGSIATYVPGTSTPKATWLDPLQAALNTNPIILDAAGRCVMYGDGEYRLILRDAVGNEIWDQPSSTLVSAAMAPVMLAPTIADAVHLLGIDDLIAQEAADRAAADSAEQTARIAADNALGVRIDGEIARAEAAEAALDTRVTALEDAPGPAGITGVQGGAAATDGSGLCHLVFPTPFVTTCIACVVTPDSNLFVSQTAAVDYVDRFSIDIRLTVAGSATPVAGGEFQWLAIGN